MIFNESNDINSNECRVCGETEAVCNWYYGQIICEACKKFFIRSCKRDQNKQTVYKCNLDKQCKITKTTRTNCQYCRYKKCLQIGLDLNKSSSNCELSSKIKNKKCSICGAPPTGIHFGALTCEACKGFFRRSAFNIQPLNYICKADGQCFQMDSNSRSTCRLCRWNKCLEVGMSIDNIKLGRTANKVKQQIGMSNDSTVCLAITQSKKQKHQDTFSYELSNQAQQSKRIRLDLDNNFDSSSSTLSSSSSIWSNDNSPTCTYSNAYPTYYNYTPTEGDRSYQSQYYNSCLTSISSYLNQSNQYFYNNSLSTAINEPTTSNLNNLSNVQQTGFYYNYYPVDAEFNFNLSQF